MKRAIFDRRFNGAVAIRRDTHELRELEVSGAELFPEADNAIGLRTADLQKPAAKLAPVGRALQIFLFLPQPGKAGGLGGGTASGDQAERLIVSQGYAQVEQSGRIAGQLKHRFFHVSPIGGDPSWVILKN